MLRIDPITRDDLDELGSASLQADDPCEVARRLVEVAEQGNLADPADTGYALLLAAEIMERGGALEAGVALADRAVAAYRHFGDPEYGYPRAYRAELLLKLGRQEEALAEFAALRPLLVRDPDAVTYLTDSMQAGGRADVAMQWLTEALQTALARAAADGDADEVALVAYLLVQQRRRLRDGLGLPPDGYDQFADGLQEGVWSQLEAEEDVEPDDGTAVLFWPRREFDRLLRRYPMLGAAYGRDWDDHRRRLELALTMYRDAGNARLALVTGVADELADHLDHSHGDLMDPGVRQGYVERVADRLHGTPWPPGRNDPCWCGSQTRYKKCCLPRSRS